MTAAVAVRAALRVLPIVFQAQGIGYAGDQLPHIALSVFRAISIAWDRARYSLRSKEFAAAAAQASLAASVASEVASEGFAYRGRTAPRPALAASKAALSAAYALDTSANSTVDVAADAAFAADAVAAFWSAISIDTTRVDEGVMPSVVASSPLWPNSPSRFPYGVPELLWSLWQDMKATLHAANQGWDVWTIWYEDRLEGRIRDEERELAYVLIEDDLWKQGPAIVNAEIKRRIDELERAAPVPPEPSSELGPVLQVTERGLEIISQPSEGDFDEELQIALHDRLRRVLPALTDATHKVANAHPVLDHVVSEYSDLASQPFDQLDLASLWAVGTGLLAFRAAFTNQASGMMTEPLEPGHLALLQQAAEIHGAFILGFPQGRELTDRADHARLSPEIIAQIEPPARLILEKLARASDFVEARTRKFIAVVDETLFIHGWETARTGHAAYAVTRNSLIALGKVLIRANSALATVAGGILLSYADPGLQMTQHIIQFMLENTQSITSFAEPFPEFRSWICFLIDHMDREK